MINLSQKEFEILIADITKTIKGDIAWQEDPEHLGSFIFQKQILSTANYPIFIKGNFNFKRGVLSHTIIYTKVGRIYGLDMGQNHRNKSNKKKVGRVHKHRWTELYRDGEAYAPSDITKPYTDIAGVWQEFCAEAVITHQGNMTNIPSSLQLDLF